MYILENYNNFLCLDENKENYRSFAILVGLFISSVLIFLYIYINFPQLNEYVFINITNINCNPPPINI